MSTTACFANPCSARLMAWRLQSAQMSVEHWLFTAATLLASKRHAGHTKEAMRRGTGRCGYPARTPQGLAAT